MNLNVLSRIDGALNRLFEAGERRAEPRPADGGRWMSWLRGGMPVETAAGVRVTEQSSLQCSAVFACVRVLAETLASLPLHVYERSEPRGRRIAYDHPLYELLHNRPNPEMTSFEFRETLMGHVATWGNGFAEKEFNRAGRITALWPMRPDRTDVLRLDGDLFYRFTFTDGQTETLPAYRVMHLRGLGFDGVMGYSVVRMAARQAVGLAIATEEFGATFFRNGARPGLVVVHPGKLSDESRLRLLESVNREHQGLSNAHRNMALEEGMAVHEVGVPPEDAQYLETRSFEVRDIARIFRVPLHLVGDLERATFSNIEHQSIDFVVYSMGPWFMRWEQRMDLDLFSAEERGRFYTKFLVAGLLRGDIQSRYEAYMKGFQMGSLSPNDIRELEDHNPIDGGDAYYVPINMMRMDQAGVVRANNQVRAAITAVAEARDGAFRPESEQRERLGRIGAGRQRLARSYEGLLATAAGKVLRREIADVRRAAKKHLRSMRSAGQVGAAPTPSPSPEIRGGESLCQAKGTALLTAAQERGVQDFRAWLVEFYEQHARLWMETMLPILLNLADQVGASVAEELAIGEPLNHEAIQRFIEQYAEAMGKAEANSSRLQIEALVREALQNAEDPDPVPAIEERLDAWDETRAGQVADEHCVTGVCALAVSFYAASRIVAQYVIVNVGDSCAYCQALDGRVVGMDEVIIKAGEEFQPDGADVPLTSRHDIRHPQFHGGCDCQVAAVMG